MKKILIIAIALLGLLLADTAVSPGQHASGPTPYTLRMPEFVSIYFDPMPIPEDNPLTVEGIYLGRKLFYEKRLSANHTMSCATCHQQENGFADFRQFSLGLHDEVGIRNSMAIVNLGWEKRLFWDGRATSLEHQISDPVTNPIEMNNSWDTVVQTLQNTPEYPALFYKAFGSTAIDSNAVMKALAQFERTLVSFNTRFDAYYFNGIADTLTEEEARGLELFMGRGNCNHCHSDVLLTDNMFRNNGLDAKPDEGYAKVTGKKTDIGKFKVPSLRNVAATAPYMHDGRFATLRDVVDFYSEGIQPRSPNIDVHMEPLGKGLRLTIEEKKELMAFLKTLTDYEFLKNPDFAAPE